MSNNKRIVLGKNLAWMLSKIGVVEEVEVVPPAVVNTPEPTVPELIEKLRAQGVKLFAGRSLERLLSLDGDAKALDKFIKKVQAERAEVQTQVNAAAHKMALALKAYRASQLVQQKGLQSLEDLNDLELDLQALVQDGANEIPEDESAPEEMDKE